MPGLVQELKLFWIATLVWMLRQDLLACQRMLHLYLCQIMYLHQESCIFNLRSVRPVSFRAAFHCKTCAKRQSTSCELDLHPAPGYETLPGSLAAWRPAQLREARSSSVQPLPKGGKHSRSIRFIYIHLSPWLTY